MWIIALIMTAMGDSTVSDSPPSTAADIHLEMDASMNQAMTPTNKLRKSNPVVVSCPQGMCQRINHTRQEAYNQTMLTNGWLSMANRYEIGSVLIPKAQSKDPRRFLQWQTVNRSLWMMVESGSPTSYFATWTLEALKPTGNPFDPHRLQPLEQTVDYWLAKCNQARPIEIDERQNETAWSGTGCNGWDLWLEYNPTEERALSVLAVKK